MKKYILKLFLLIFVISFIANNVFAQNKPEEFTEKAWNLFYKKDMKDSAIIILNKAIKIYPKDVPIMKWLGKFYDETQQYDKAKAIWDKALLVKPNDTYCLVNKGYSCYYLKQFQNMENCYSKALQIEPKNPLILSNLIELHYHMGFYKKVVNEVSNYKKLGGNLESIFVYGLICESLLRQFDKINLPPIDWKPIYKPFPALELNEIASPWLKQLCVSNINDRLSVFGDTKKESTSGKRYKFAGTKEKPFEYATGFYIWDATVIFDEKYGILISNGSKIKYELVINNVEVIKYGTVKNWSIVWD